MGFYTGFRVSLAAEHDFLKSNLLSDPAKSEPRVLIRLFLIRRPVLYGTYVALLEAHSLGKRRGDHK